MNYTPPVSTFLTLGRPDKGDWQDYVNQYGFTSDHIPELTVMLLDWELEEADSESPQVWAALHAWRTLSQLGGSQALQVIFDYFDETHPDNDWFFEDLVHHILGYFGRSALPHCTAKFALELDEEEIDKLNYLTEALAHLGDQHPELRDECVAILGEAFTSYQQNTETLNAFIINALVDLHSLEHINLIQEAYEADVVDETVRGDWEDVQIALGLLAERITPAPRFIWAKDPRPEPAAPASAQPEAQKTDRQWLHEVAKKKKAKAAKKKKKRRR